MIWQLSGKHFWKLWNNYKGTPLLLDGRVRRKDVLFSAFFFRLTLVCVRCAEVKQVDEQPFHDSLLIQLVYLILGRANYIVMEVNLFCT